jgi:uncharacterized protein
MIDERGMKIAIVGSGISGLTAAYLLHRNHEITLFEANGYIGGHTHTVEVEQEGEDYSVDTGFIVFNEKNYPNFVKILDQLEVESEPTNMSFSVRCARTGLEYNGTSLNGLFAQRRNLLRPSFYRMVIDILRFYREAHELLEGGDESMTLGEYLGRKRFSPQFVEHHIVPMGAAIWSADPADMYDFPARHFARFFDNHGLLQWKNRPQWRVVKGGSQQYVKRMTRTFEDCIRPNSPVERVTRIDGGVEVKAANRPAERFDEVIMAAHSDQTLRMLAEPSPAERDILGAIRYQTNETVLHTDRSLLPRRRLAWASWNYFLPAQKRSVPTVTYDMNILQGLNSGKHFCVTLNRSEEIAPEEVLQRFTYHHPIFDVKGVAAQRRWGEISGVDRIHYCGAYWGFGFHEDGVVSGLKVAQMLVLRHD